MIQFFDEIQTQLETKKPFVVYRKPNEATVKAVLQNNDTVNYTNDYTETGFVFAPFDAENGTVILPLERVLSTEFIAEEPSNKNVIADSNTEASPSAKEFHTKVVSKAIRAIKNGELEKVVLSRKIAVAYSKTPIQLFKELLTAYTTAFCYLWYHPKVGMWLGATPEVLLKTQNQRIETSSLAGTQIVTDDLEPTWKDKEIQEQKVVTDFIVTALKGKVSNVKVSETASVKAGKLWHLRTKITGLMANNLEDILLALHPTPATCGLPKLKAKAFILQNENYNRGFYTGFLGELNYLEETGRPNTKRNIENRAYTLTKKVTNVYANLRCAALGDTTAVIYVGGGITIDSHPEKEWEETVAKSGTMLRIIVN